MRSASSESINIQISIDHIVKLQTEHKHSEVISLCGKLILNTNKNSIIYYLRSFSYYLIGDFDNAITDLSIALHLNPENIRFYELYALIAYDFGELKKAIELLTVVISEERNNYYCWNLLANALLECGLISEAHSAVKHALEIEPNKPDAYFTNANILLATNNPTQASQEYDNGLNYIGNIDMSHAARRIEIAFRADDSKFIDENIYNYLSLKYCENSLIKILLIYVNHLLLSRRIEESFQTLEILYKQYPDYSREFDFAKIELYILTNKIDKAIIMLKKQIEEFPEDSRSKFKLSLCQLSCGEVADGFKNYEARWEGSTVSKEKRELPIPMWKGQSLDNSRLLIWGEQGIGDQIRFAGLIPYVRADHSYIRIECTPKLIPLFQKAFPYSEIGYRLNSDIDYNIFDYHIPMGSLPLITGEMVSRSEPLKAWMPTDIEHETVFRNRFNSDGKKRLVGLCWRSGAMGRQRELNYFTVSCFQKFAEEKNTRFIILQHDAIESEIITLREMGLDVMWPADIDQRDDLISTRDLVGSCDVIVSIGSTVCTLAGAIGVPNILMAPQGSWIMLNKIENPWSPNSIYIPFDLRNPVQAIENAAKQLNTTFRDVSWASRPRR